jgi:hypothetical protein
VTDKSTIYTKIVEKTGTKRSTIRRIAGDFKRELERKVKILTDSSNTKRIHAKPYSFISQKVRLLWTEVTQRKFKEVKCAICKKHICYVYGKFMNNLVCDNCKSKFPNKEIRRDAKRY